MTTSSAVEVMARVMAPYVGATMARSAAEAHCQKLGFSSGTLTPDQLDALLAKVGAGLNIFLGRDKAATVIGEVKVQLAALEAGR